MNEKILLLVRDPRGVIASRWGDVSSWCLGKPDCDDPRRLCSDMEADYYTAKIFLAKYPNNFRYR